MRRSLRPRGRYCLGPPEGDGFLMTVRHLGGTRPELGFLVGAGEGNRTLMTSLEVRESGCRLTWIEVAAGRRGQLTVSSCG